MSWICLPRKVAPAKEEHLGGSWGLYLAKLKAAHNEAGVPLEGQLVSAPKDVDELVQKTKKAGSSVLFGYIAARRAKLYAVSSELLRLFEKEFSWELFEQVEREQVDVETRFSRLQGFADKYKLPKLTINEKETVFVKVSRLGKEALILTESSFEVFYDKNSIRAAVYSLRAGLQNIASQLLLFRISPRVTTLESSDLRGEFTKLEDNIVRAALLNFRHLKEVHFVGESNLTPAAFAGGHHTLQTLSLKESSIVQGDIQSTLFPELQTLIVVEVVYNWPVDPDVEPKDLKSLLLEWKGCDSCASFDLSKLYNLLSGFVKSPSVEVIDLLREVSERKLFIHKPQVEKLIYDACMAVANKLSSSDWDEEYSLGRSLCNLFACWFDGRSSNETKSAFFAEMRNALKDCTNNEMRKEGQLVVGKDEMWRALNLLGVMVLYHEENVEAFFYRLKGLEKALPCCVGEQKDVIIYEMRHLIAHLVKLSTRTDFSMSKREIRDYQKKIAEPFKWLLKRYEKRLHPEDKMWDLLPMASAAALLANVGEEQKEEIVSLIHNLPTTSWRKYLPYEKLEEGMFAEEDIPSELKALQLGGMLKQLRLSDHHLEQLLGEPSNQ